MTREDILQSMYDALKESWDWVLEGEKPGEGLNYISGVFDMTRIMLNKYAEEEKIEQG